MKLLRLFIVSIIIFQCPISYSQTQESTAKVFQYEEECLPPELKSHMNDTIYDLYLVFKQQDIESIQDLVLDYESSEKIYSKEELFSNNKKFKKKDNHLFVKIGKANISWDIQISGITDDGSSMKFKNANSKSSKSDVPPKDRILVKKYDIKPKKNK